MARLFKFAIFGIAAYAIATATPSQQVAMLDGLTALKDAITDACQRDGSPCTRAISQLRSVLVGFKDSGETSGDSKPPWPDYPSPRSVDPKPET
jgi:hypothetical protein